MTTDGHGFRPACVRTRCRLLFEGMSTRLRSSSFESNHKPCPTRETPVAKAAIDSLFAVDRRSHLIPRGHRLCAVGHRAVLPEEAAQAVPTLNSSGLLHRSCSAFLFSLPEPMPMLLKHPLRRPGRKQPPEIPIRTGYGIIPNHYWIQAAPNCWDFPFPFLRIAFRQRTGVDG